MVVVHHLNDSRSQRILWLLEELGVPYEIVHHTRDPETGLAPPSLKAVHPFGKSPVVEDGGRMIAETGAIADYLLRHYGNGRLQPSLSAPNYDEYVHWMHYAEGSAMPALIVRIYVARIGDAAKEHLPPLDYEVDVHLRYIDHTLEGRDYLLGPDLTAADIQLSFVGELAAARFDFSKYPNIVRWISRFQARQAYKEALTRGGPYSFSS